MHVTNAENSTNKSSQRWHLTSALFGWPLRNGTVCHDPIVCLGYSMRIEPAQKQRLTSRLHRIVSNIQPEHASNARVITQKPYIITVIAIAGGWLMYAHRINFSVIHHMAMFMCNKISSF